MKKWNTSLPLKNLASRPGRTFALVALAACLSFSILAGTIVTASLRRGLSSLQDRLGADIMVVPYEASTRTSLESIVLQGNIGYFYMDDGIMDKIAGMDGVEQISAQFFLASVSNAGCCSLPVQIIGFDPDTDFTVTPWIKKSYGRSLEDMDVVVGSDLTAFVGDTLKFYGQEVRVAAKLDKTGTNLDTAVYTNQNTIKRLIQASLDKKMNTFESIDPDRVVSCILLNVADGYAVEEVLGDINIHVRKVKAVQTKNMISGISGSLEGVSLVIGILSGAVWILSFVILVMIFAVNVSGRKKEFAVLRSMGASASYVSRAVMTEGVLVSAAGSLLGVVLGMGIVLPFATLIENALQLPFLLPGAGSIALLALGAFLMAMLAGALTSAIVSRSVNRADTGLILREG